MAAGMVKLLLESPVLDAGRFLVWFAEHVWNKGFPCISVLQSSAGRNHRRFVERSTLAEARRLTAPRTHEQPPRTLQTESPFPTHSCACWRRTVLLGCGAWLKEMDV